MSTLTEQIVALATRVGTECKTLHTKTGELTNLTTSNKTSLVDALNEVKTLAAGVDTAVAALIDDTQSVATKVYSSQKVDSQITAAKQAVKDDLLGGAGEAYDTLKELADAIGDNADAISALETVAAGHVKYSEAQTLTVEQQAQARTNIGAASATDLTTLSNAVGDIAGADFVGTFEAALAGTTGGGEEGE